MSATRGPAAAGYLGPRYWPTWCAYLFLRVLALLPFRLGLGVGRAFGRLLFAARRRQRQVAGRNLEICFPELDAKARKTLVRRHFESLGLSLVEMAIAWYTPSAKLERLVTVSGREHLEAALARGRGVILVTAHFTMLELGVAALESVDAAVTCLYRPRRNALMEAMIVAGRSRFSRSHVASDNVRAMIRRLKANDIVLYVPDQTNIGNQSALLPFFGEPALTNIATSKLAKISGATVLTYFFRREPDASGYCVEIGPPFEGMPGDDPIEDARRLFARLEDFIRTAPEQYLWSYKRFKRRPPPLTDPYAEA